MGLTEARKRLRRRGSADPTECALFANILEQRRILKEAANSSRQRRRKEKIPPTVNIQPESQEPKKSPHKPSGELKPYRVEIWERE